ncbi:MAG: hypothetical protein J6B75_05380 [Ruminococcus sp.]|nr:hypothetical protein [Ruminococcus sp.]
MGTQFWWFYDVMVGAVLLVCIFLSGRKGFMKGLVAALGLVIAAAAAFGISGAVADSIGGSAIKNGNAKKLEKCIDSSTFTDRYSAYLESMGYTIKVDKSKLENILDSDVQYDEAIAKYVNNINARKVEENDEILLEKIHEGYAVVIGDIAEEALNKFAAETAAETIRSDSSGMQELIPLLRDQENMRPAAGYIAEHYTSAAYETLISLIAYLTVFIVLGALIVFSANAFLGGRETSPTSVSSNMIGGIAGIVVAGTVILAIAVVVRLWAVMGSDEMLFFNNEAVEKSYVFKYFYEFAMNL